MLSKNLSYYVPVTIDELMVRMLKTIEKRKC